MPLPAPSKLPIFRRHFPIMVQHAKVRFLLATLTHTYLNWLSPQDEEVLRPLHYEVHKLLTQDPLNLICLQGHGRW